ncbi:siderophore-interacting protein [Paraburkholderia caballeronis]|uniref:NADPH-dependent ferric siderophore reductase, contains FAD-binding and SIP domains n=1 Tax=Paraburkholderia caballeronis TaxID=416943 RepID=A0A1H7SA58_9BURK|nr:siderophore-interacting protein [Paraburkholderia caballeronis]PXW22926.1 NADPH-dependent ferric siderophore reductase [Paraburkholderia caballeronis]PXW97311.1 NADPH-dependent ferric siderophore reductase [Paraburkholderia caballeronis]RAJ93831.1 NADPH-dependent ferric siderophore reductase [Paraburkholderia caballeronis]SED56359.1 NADPH-dependent ferric siderophore reductase, contains FAD-binding and SIP domains [Paraburkholderia caballeronis]SEL68427.1 NADPH-dependent ferric siderophore 
MQNPSDLEIVRVRHPLKFRLLHVARVQTLAPALVRVTLTGDDLRDFESASFDDHVKVFFPPPGEDKPVLPSAGPDGIVFPEGVARPAARDYTPRRFDRAAGELDLEFVLHDAGPATAWAAQAQPGQYLGVGGPRGSMVIPDGFDWHLLIGDETALPAIARRLEELPDGTRVAVVVEVANRDARIELPTDADLYAVWCYRDDADAEAPLLDAVADVWLPPGEGFVWAAGEASSIRAVRTLLVDRRGVDRKRIRASAYWRRGAQATHESIDD